MPLLSVPPDWATTYSPWPNVSLTTRPPQPGAGFHSNLVLTTESIGEQPWREWQREVDSRLPLVLADYQLLDLQLMTIAGHEGVRRLAAHAGDDGGSLTLEQWAVVVRGMGYTVSATTATLSYPVEGRRLAAVARTLAPLGRR